jgi:hypothetical protein
MGIHSKADFMGQLMDLLIKDTELKTLMNINSTDINNPTTLRKKYFLQTYVNSQTVTDPICLILIRDAPSSDTNNEFVKINGVIIEIFVHDSVDTAGISGYKRRTHQISDRITKLLHRKLICDSLVKFVDGNELQSSTANFKRSYVRFQYKAIYA